MIVEWFLSVVAGLWHWFVGLIPQTCCGVPVGQLPGWLSTTFGGFNDASTTAGSMGAWIPWDTIKPALVCVLFAYVIAALIYTTRWLLGVVSWNASLGK